MNESKIEEFIKENGELTYSNVGTSMMPLLRQGKDIFTITKRTDERFKKYDVVLYRRHGRHILHRIIEVRDNDYVIRGDNCIYKEYGITDSDIIWVMTGFVRNGKTHTVTEPGFRVYSVVWCALAPVRIVYLKLRHRIGKLLR